MNGQDILFNEIEPTPSPFASSYTYEEIDADLFGEDLTSEAYQEVGQLAAVGLAASP